MMQGARGKERISILLTSSFRAYVMISIISSERAPLKKWGSAHFDMEQGEGASGNLESGI